MKLCFSLEIHESRDSQVNQISHILDKCPKFSLISGSYISFNIYKYIRIHESRKDPVGRKKTSGRRKNRKRKVWSINIVNIHYMQKLFVLSGTELETSLLLSSFNSRRKDGILWNAIFWPYHGQHGKSWTLSICSHIHKIWSRLYLSAFPHIRWKGCETSTDCWESIESIIGCYGHGLTKPQSSLRTCMQMVALQQTNIFFSGIATDKLPMFL